MGVSPDVWATISVGIIRTFVYLYEVLTYIPYYIAFQPDEKLKKSQRKRAKPLKAGKTDSPYRDVDYFDKLTTTLFPECNTLDDLFLRAVALYGPTRCIGSREVLSEEEEIQPNGKMFKKLIQGDYYWETYDEVSKRLDNLGRGLHAIGQEVRKSILIFAETRAEWMITAQACMRYNYPVVTLYASLGDQAVIYGINETQVTHVITSAELLPKFKKILQCTPKVTHVIYMNGGKRLAVKDFPVGVKIKCLAEVETIGSSLENSKYKAVKPTRDDIAFIMYTSGSTGLPKGVLMNHGNLMCGLSGQVKRVPGLGPTDSYCGYLPLAHVLELTAEIACLCHGVRIGYSSPSTLTDQSSKIKKGSKGDTSAMKPSLVAAVPLIMDRLYKAVWEKVNEGGSFSKALFHFAYDYKNHRIYAGWDTPLINRILFSKVRKLIGGNIRMMLSGGAPLSTDTQKFMNICFCIPVGQGYGLTETCGAGAIQEPTDLSTGRVGAPLSCSQFLLRNWEEGGYRTDDSPFSRGEIMIGGGNVAVGYYNNEEKTNEDFITIDGMRYFCTGDIGQVEEDGCVRIIDRKKDLVKLSTGEYLSLGKVEGVLTLCPLIDQICIYAESNRIYAVALVVPNQKQLQQMAKKLGMNGVDFAQLCKKKELEMAVLKEMSDVARNGKLERFEIPQKVSLLTEAWTPDKGLVTEAYKLKRKSLKDSFQAELDELYR